MTDFTEPCPVCSGAKAYSDVVSAMLNHDCHEGRVPTQWAVEAAMSVQQAGLSEGMARTVLRAVMRAAP